MICISHRVMSLLVLCEETDTVLLQAMVHTPGDFYIPLATTEAALVAS